MLTVKNVLPRGSEEIYLTPFARFEPGCEAAGPDGAFLTDDALWIADRDGRHLPLTNGTVYVMNDQGKTVSRYMLKWPGPEDASAI